MIKQMRVLIGGKFSIQLVTQRMICFNISSIHDDCCVSIE